MICLFHCLKKDSLKKSIIIMDSFLKDLLKVSIWSDSYSKVINSSDNNYKSKIN